MCGIAGVFAYAQEARAVDEQELSRIREAMAQRGPDDAGTWISVDRRVGLAHRRLAIIDLSESGAQPMADPAGQVRITFNGEIYNYRELRRELEGKGYVFRSSSDTEVLLHLYLDRGDRMVDALRGMYAFALWDERKKGIFVARDPFGIKPLYYADNGRTFRFASQVKALLKGEGIADDTDPAGEVGFLTWGFVPEPFTLYREIRALPAGSHMWIDAAGRRPHVAFFRLRDEFARAEELARAAQPRDVAEVVEALRHSVRRHMVADVPVAAFLSAGLDSATTVALASEAADSHLRTLTLGFREYAGTPNDETALAAQVSARFGAGHETRWITRAEFEESLHDIFEAMDQPSTDGINTYLVSKAAAAAGMKVALSGLGGDEIFGGYPSFRDVPRIRRLASICRATPTAGAWLRQRLSGVIPRFISPKFAGLFEYGRSAAGAYLLRRGLFMPWELPAILDPEVAAQGWEALDTLASLERSIEGLRSSRSIVSALELEWYMRNQLLRDSDWASMAHSLEIRVPYVDVDLLRRALPAVLREGVGKADVARRMRPAIPVEVLGRAKTGFLVPVQQWCTGISENEEPGRGLRGWATIVIGKALVHPMLRPQPHSPHGSALAAAATAASYRTINAVLRGFSYVLWPRARPQHADRICIFRIGNIGDVVCALPAMRAIRKAYPHAHLTLLSSPGARGMPGAREVLQGVDWIDEIKIYNSEDISGVRKLGAMLLGLRAQRFDLWIDLPNNLTTISRQFRDMTFARLTGARWARGWRIDTLSWAAQAQSEYLHFPGEVDRVLGVVQELGLDTTDVEFGLPRLPATVERVDDLLERAGIADKPLVAIAPGAKRSTNLWFPERFAEVGRHLAGTGCSVALIGGAQESEMCASIARRIGASARSFAGALSLAESAELLRRCALLVCVDSGAQHIASAVGTPCVSLFSFWQMRGKWHPYGARNVVLQKWVPCHTCLLDTCPMGNLCMRKIGASEVIEHAVRLLPPDLARKNRAMSAEANAAAS